MYKKVMYIKNYIQEVLNISIMSLL